MREDVNAPVANDVADSLMTRDGDTFAGMHVIVDLYGASQLDNIKLLEQAMKRCIAECGATLLHLHLHHFTPNNGVTGVAILAESHISVHTWPEREYAAFDIFMCGNAQPELATSILAETFKPDYIETRLLRRGSELRGLE
ncbi:MAG: adenosylmethionine decarboxylase [Bermanella sp.]